MQVGIVGSSSNAWSLGGTFKANFGLKINVTGAISGGGTYKPKVQTTDTGPFTSVVRISGFRPKTTGVTLTFTGKATVPVNFEVNAQAIAAAPEPCACESLELRLSPSNADFGKAFFLDWSMECTGGAGKCSGTLTAALAAAGRAKGVRLEVRRSGRVDVAEAGDAWRVTCTGDCGIETTRNEVLTIFAPAGEKFGKSVGSVTVEVDRFCRRELAPKIFDIKFNADGTVSKRRSDLNGNGILDGKEK